MGADDEPTRPRVVQAVLDGLGWLFIMTVSLPVVLLWMFSTAFKAAFRTAVFGIAPAALVVFVTAHVPLPLQIIVVFCATGWLIFLGFSIVVAEGFEDADDGGPAVWRLLHPSTGDSEADRIFLMLCVLAAAVAVFASLTVMLAEQDAVTITDWAAVDNQAASSVGFFLWHFFDAIPLLDLTETLRWREPLTYHDPWMGAVVVLFKLVVIVPVIAAIRAAWRSAESEPVAEAAPRTTP